MELSSEEVQKMKESQVLCEKRWTEMQSLKHPVCQFGYCQKLNSNKLLYANEPNKSYMKQRDSEMGKMERTRKLNSYYAYSLLKMFEPAHL